MTGGQSVPDRSDLIRQIERANRIAWPWILVQIGLSVSLAVAIDWRAVVASPWFSLFVVAVIVGPHLMALLRHWVQNKKEIDDLKERTRFGEFDKHRLRGLVNDTLNRLNIPPPGPPVYITADKTLNAGAINLGAGGVFRSLNGVYLNRQVLHRLTAAEVQDIIGHELGHYYRYYLVSQRCEGLTLLLGALAGLLVTQWIGLSDIIGMLALTGCGAASWYVAGKLYAGNAEAIEYLCDDFGAHVHGVAVSINGLLKIGVDSEIQLAVHQQELLARRHKNLTARDIIEAIEAAVPYGHSTKAELEAAVEQSLKRQSEKRRKLTPMGFFEYAWLGDDDEGELEAEMLKVKRLQKLPRLDWEQLLDEPGRIELDDDQIEELVEMLESYPEYVLFRLPEEVGGGDGVHPPIRNRILYLWKNRREIASGGD